MPTLLETDSRTGEVVATVVRLICAGGLRAVTLRAVAEQMRMAPSSLKHHLTDLDRIWRLTIHRTARALLDEWSRRLQHEGVAGILPPEGSPEHEQEQEHDPRRGPGRRRSAPGGAAVPGPRPATAICRRADPLAPGRAREALAGHVGTAVIEGA